MSSSDWKLTKLENSDFKCWKCKSNEIEYCKVDSSDGAYEDIHYKCLDCKNDWWYESSDY